MKNSLFMAKNLEIMLQANINILKVLFHLVYVYFNVIINF